MTLLIQIINRILEYSANDNNYDFLIAGDLNGRVSVLPDYIVNDNITYLPLSRDVYDPDESTINVRYNEDTVVNEHGRKVLEMCKMCGLRIANGRVGNPIQSGAKTFIGQPGSSTIDLIICSPAFFSKLEKLSILPIT